MHVQTPDSPNWLPTGRASPWCGVDAAPAVLASPLAERCWCISLFHIAPNLRSAFCAPQGARRESTKEGVERGGGMKLTPAVVQQLLPEGQQLESATRLDASNKDITEVSTSSCCMPLAGESHAAHADSTVKAAYGGCSSVSRSCEVTAAATAATEGSLHFSTSACLLACSCMCGCWLASSRMHSQEAQTCVHSRLLAYNCPPATCRWWSLRCAPPLPASTCRRTGCPRWTAWP